MISDNSQTYSHIIFNQIKVDKQFTACEIYCVAVVGKIYCVAVVGKIYCVAVVGKIYCVAVVGKTGRKLYFVKYK